MKTITKLIVVLVLIGGFTTAQATDKRGNFRSMKIQLLSCGAGKKSIKCANKTLKKYAVGGKYLYIALQNKSTHTTTYKVLTGSKRRRHSSPTWMTSKPSGQNVQFAAHAANLYAGWDTTAKKKKPKEKESKKARMCRKFYTGLNTMINRFHKANTKRSKDNIALGLYSEVGVRLTMRTCNNSGYKPGARLARAKKAYKSGSRTSSPRRR